MKEVNEFLDEASRSAWKIESRFFKYIYKIHESDFEYFNQQSVENSKNNWNHHWWITRHSNNIVNVFQIMKQSRKNPPDERKTSKGLQISKQS